MSGDKKWTRRAAVGFIGTGAGLFALDTSAATQVYSDRGVNLGTTEDIGALLPLIDESGNAKISTSGEEAVIYNIAKSTENDLDWSFTEVNILEVVSTTGDKINSDDITVFVSGRNVVVSCSDSTFTGKYKLTLNLKAEAGAEGERLSVLTERATTDSIPIDCTFDFGSSNNYSDTKAGKADEPGDDASGEIINPKNIGDENTGVTTLQGDGGLKVGFRLPAIASAGCYTLNIKRNNSDVTGNLRAYLVNNGGNRLTSKFTINDTEVFTIDGENATNVDENKNELYLIFEDGNRGKVTQKIKFINLQAGC